MWGYFSIGFERQKTSYYGLSQYHLAVPVVLTHNIIYTVYKKKVLPGHKAIICKCAFIQFDIRLVIIFFEQNRNNVESTICIFYMI